ncbi:MAG: DUF2341 domain-containing protein [Chloroflexi bacterium]|nr:DUF2341 domain-containing protein [Chloroflexota bacterium]
MKIILNKWILWLVVSPLLLTLLLSGISPKEVEASPGWYDNAWAYRKKITIQSSQVAANLSDFPMLVSYASDSDLANDAQNDGDDILFTAADETTKLSHEIEKFNGATGELAAWVKIPSLSSTTNTEIYMYYENPGAANQENATDVWSNGYEAVYHIHDDFQDSTGNHDATNNGSQDITGIIADGQDFIPVDEIQAGSWSVSGSDITIQGWVNPDDFDQDDPRVVSKAKNNKTDEKDHVFMLGLGGSGERYVRGRIKTGTSDSSGTTTLVASTNPLTTATWQLIALSYDGSSMRLFKNGTQVTSTSKTGNLRQNSWAISMGNNPGKNDSGYTSWDGKLDEIRISSVARSGNWLSTEYNNQNFPFDFYATGSEEAAPPPAASPVVVGGEVYPANKLYVLAPWIILTVGAFLVTGVWVLRKHRATS